MTFLLGVKFIVRPVMTTKEAMQSISAKKRAVQSVVCGVIVGFICGFVGAGGGMMMLLILTSVLGYELKTAVGTSVFIMTFTALTGAVSHFAIGGRLTVLCAVRRIHPAVGPHRRRVRQQAEPKTLNRSHRRECWWCWEPWCCCSSWWGKKHLPLSLSSDKRCGPLSRGTAARFGSLGVFLRRETGSFSPFSFFPVIFWKKPLPFPDICGV